DSDNRRDRTRSDFTHAVPELAYWTRGQVRRWLERYRTRRKPTERGEPAGSSHGEPEKRASKYQHPLLGIFSCHACGRTLVAYGLHGYTCPAKDGGLCPHPQTLGEKAARTVLRRLLPDA